MQGLASFTFKFLGASIIFLLLFMTFITAMDVSITTSKIMANAELAQQDLARNNGFSTTSLDMFNELYEEIIGRSECFQSAEITEPAADDYRQYGEIHEMVVEASFDIMGWVLNSTVDSADRGNVWTTDLRFEYRVPCLRYMK